MDYDAAYLPKNHFIKAESMPVNEYAALFFPFEKPEFKKGKDETRSFSILHYQLFFVSPSTISLNVSSPPTLPGKMT